MRKSNFEALHPCGGDCPSDLVLDEFVAGELAAERERDVASHVEHCEHCAEQVAVLRRGFDAIEGVDERALLAGVRRRLDEPKRVSWSELLARWFGDWRTAVAAVGVAAVLLVAVWPRSGIESSVPEFSDSATFSESGVRSKGGLVLHVFRATAEGSEEMLSGDRFQPGDRLRFAIDMPESGHVSVVGLNADGALYDVWPLGDGETFFEAGDHIKLPGAVALDDAPGSERLFLVHCPETVGVSSCVTEGANQAPACPEGCATTSFVIQKER